MSICQIRQRLDGILEFLQPHWDLVNCHMVSFLTEQHWDCLVPVGLRQEVPNTQTVERCIDSVFWDRRQNECEDFPEFRKFLAATRQHSLRSFSDVTTTIEDFYRVLEVENTQTRISIKEFMSAKKRHEVEMTAQLVDDMISVLPPNHSLAQDCVVVDAGDGKGYLSSYLALQYGRRVLGIDSNAVNTENALERNRKLQRVWNGLKVRAELEMQGQMPPRRGRTSSTQNQISSSEISAKSENYKTTSNFITSDLDVVQVVRHHFPASRATQSPPNICLIGLHTCGNLSATCLRVFHRQPQCRLLCNIGCCYHLLKEAYSTKELFGNKLLVVDKQQEAGFPMSQFLQSKHIQLGRNARMLATQSIERMLSAQVKPNISLFYRSLLEVLIWKADVPFRDIVQVGKIRKFSSFSEYVQLCCEKCESLAAMVEDEQVVAQVEQQFAAHKSYLELFYLLRMTFAPVLESLILLDRLLFLKELGHERSHLISLFDPVVSPRHYAIVSIKS